jgi:hypothetical protein
MPEAGEKTKKVKPESPSCDFDHGPGFAANTVIN